MGDPEFVEFKIREMLQEARSLLFEASNPRGGVPALLAKWTTELSPHNAAYIQPLSPQKLSAFLRTRGCGTDDPPEDTDAPILALLAHTLGRFVDAATAFDQQKIDAEHLQFCIDTAVEDCMMLRRGFDNPAD